MSQLTSLCAYICIYSIVHLAFSFSKEPCHFLYDCSDWKIDNYWTLTTSRLLQNNSNMPKTDHTMGKVGSYLYLNSPPNQTTVARLLSNPLKQLHTCLAFWYSMYENDLQSLKVFRTTGNSTMVEIWNKTGNMPNLWNEARVNFSYERGFQIIFEGTKTSAGHMALDDISVTEVCPATSTQSISEKVKFIGNADLQNNQPSSSPTHSISDNVTSNGNTDLKNNQQSYGVYVGTATGFAAILLIAYIVTLIIVRKKRRRQESQKKETIIRREFPNANKYGGIYQKEKANISDQNPDGKRPEGNESHLNVHTSTNYAYAEIPDAQFDQVANTCDENTHILPYKQANLSDYAGADDVYNTTYEPSRQIDDNTYDHISNDEYEDTTNVLKRDIFDDTYNHTTEKETHDETQAAEKYVMANQTYELVRTYSATNSTYV